MASAVENNRRKVVVSLLKDGGEQPLSELHKQFAEAIYPGPCSKKLLKRVLDDMESDGLVERDMKRVIQRAIAGEYRNTPQLVYRLADE